MIEKRSAADRILIAQLMGTAKRQAQWREMTEAEQAPGIAELRELAAGRTDLLAEVAGILEGASEGEPTGPRSVQAAQLCRLAWRRPGGDPGVDRGRSAPEGRGAAPAILGRPARWGSATAARPHATPGSMSDLSPQK